ncbi:MAG: sialidase family protein [Pseudoxanthomonas sp.]
MHRFLIPCLLLLSACSEPAPPIAPSPSPATLALAPRVVDEWPLPLVASAAQPDLVKTADGRLLLSWIEIAGNGHALKFAAFADESWSAPREIARGDDWFVNWADTPHLLATEDGALWAQWLRQSASATYAYDVVLSRSGDGGATWSRAVTVNNDGTPTEHGFVSLWPQSRQSVGIAWLDGRNTVGGGHAAHAGHGAGAMALRVANFDAALNRSAETELDARACDCCQTDAAMTARGPLLVYRDRDSEEIRDIVGTRLHNGAWTLPRKVRDDRWKMPACPVNGPALVAKNSDAWVAWYTAAGDMPKVQVAHSSDAGDHFAASVALDHGVAVQGRVGIAIDAGEVWVNWTREDAGGQSLWLTRHSANLGKELQRVQVAALQGRGRATGFPQMAVANGVGYLVWTDVVDGKPVLQGARLGAKPRAGAASPPGR